MSAVTPQITKSFSSQDYDYLKKVTYSSIKLSFFLIYSITVPIAFNIDYILSLWLHEVPVYVSGFIKLLMVNSCVVSLTGSISALVEANGNVKYTQICYTIVMILSTCGSYFLLSHKFSPNSIYYMLLFSTVGSMIIRLYFAKRYNLIRLKDFLKVLLSSIFPLCFCYFFIFYIIFEFLSNSQGLEAILISFVISIVFLPLYGYFIFLSSTEKGLINSLLHKKNYDENKTM